MREKRSKYRQFEKPQAAGERHRRDHHARSRVFGALRYQTTSLDTAPIFSVFRSITKMMLNVSSSRADSFKTG